MPPDPPNRIAGTQRAYLWLCGTVALLASGLLFYSQTAAFAWDEGFHLVTAQLINRGKTPYLDWCFSQTPLNAYWNAFWMRLFGDTWRTANAVAALATSAAVMLTVDFVFVRFPEARWRFAGAFITALLIGLNVAVVQFGTIGQAYGLCLLLIAAAFRLAVVSVERQGVLLPALAGLFAGAAAASSLLTAPVAPVLLLWALFYDRAGNRWAKCVAFLTGVLISFLPVLRLIWIAPRQAYFNIIQYNFLFRHVEWENATPHNIEVMLSWVDCGHALLLILLAGAGLYFVATASGWELPRRAEFYLCGWLTLALCVHISTARPTFDRYYLFTVPFLGILSVAGLYATALRTGTGERPARTVILLTILLCFGLANTLYRGRDDRSWGELDEVARKVDEVTPPGAMLLADEHIYFITRRVPPSGMELEDSHKLALPAADAALFHLVSRAELQKRIDAGTYATVQTCDDDEEIEKLGLPRLYPHKADVQDCTVFWR